MVAFSALMLHRHCDTGKDRPGASSYAGSQPRPNMALHRHSTAGVGEPAVCRSNRFLSRLCRPPSMQLLLRSGLLNEKLSCRASAGGGGLVGDWEGGYAT